MNAFDTYRRGEIYYVESFYSVGSEQRSGRPAVIVSNDLNNGRSRTVEVVYLTTQPKCDMPTHVVIHSTDRTSTALCEQIHTVDVSRIGNYMATCSKQEMDNINIALLVSLGLGKMTPQEKVVEVEKIVEVVKEVPAQSDCMEELIATKARLEVMTSMYQDVLAKLIRKEREKKCTKN